MRSLALLFACLVAGPALAQSSPSPSRIRGEVVSVSGDTLVVHRTNADNVTIAFRPDTPVSAVRALKLSDIRAGCFVGVTSVPGPSGKAVAREVHVFPESMRGQGEGDRSWDLLPGSSMTNANVDTIAQAVAGRELKMSYRGGSKVIVVPESAPVVTFAEATHADVAKGRKIFVIADASAPGRYTALRAIVEKDGVAPPM